MKAVEEAFLWRLKEEHREERGDVESTLPEQARVLGSSPDSATHVLCDRG